MFNTIIGIIILGIILFYINALIYLKVENDVLSQINNKNNK